MTAGILDQRIVVSRDDTILVAPSQPPRPDKSGRIAKKKAGRRHPAALNRKPSEIVWAIRKAMYIRIGSIGIGTFKFFYIS